MCIAPLSHTLNGNTRMNNVYSTENTKDLGVMRPFVVIQTFREVKRHVPYFVRRDERC